MVEVFSSMGLYLSATQLLDMNQNAYKILESILLTFGAILSKIITLSHKKLLLNFDHNVA